MATTHHMRNRAWQPEPPGCLLMLGGMSSAPGTRPGPQGLVCLQRCWHKTLSGIQPVCPLHAVGRAQVGDSWKGGLFGGW